jgi:plastocyanin
MNDVRDTRSSGRSITLAVVGALLATMLATGLTQAASATIVAQYYAFSPSPLTIVAGSTVTWVNKDANQLKIVSDTGAFPSSGLLNPGDKYSVKFSKAGTFNYHDGFNDFMRGTIIVTAAPKATPKPTPRPTPKPTVKPTAAPTVVPTAAPSVTEEPTATAIEEPSSGPTDAGATGSATPGSGASAAPGGSGGDGSSAGSGSGSGSLDIGSILFGLALAVLLFFAWLGVQSFRRNRPGPPTGGSGGGGGASPGSGGPAGAAASAAAGAAAEKGPDTDPDEAPDVALPPFDENAPLSGG